MGESNTELEISRVEKRIKHYSSFDKILLVGEGDFSFSACLARTFGSASNMVATSLDSKELLLRKYVNARRNLEVLEENGCCIAHEVDARWMSQDPLLHFKSFDRIVFNFPHAGFHFSEHASLQIELHQDVVRGFLKNAREMVSENGEIHITHKTAHPFCKWEIEKLAKEEGLLLVEEAYFSIYDYPGYENKRGDGVHCDRAFPVGLCRTFKFTKPSTVEQAICNGVQNLGL